ncbi:MAG: hypothetical protein KA774_13315 [Burkholderiaceae bacterium]|jgi:hypothetical protein|nr:hypothetical protein [Burkholderiaceae bacterium]
MFRVLRTILVWVMALAMPLQGMAASAMLFCAPGHAGVLQGPGPAAAAVGGSHAAHAHHHGHDADAMDQAAPTIEVAADAPCAGADGPSDPPPHHGKFSCSACAACCVALALPGRLVLPAASGPSQQVPTATAAPVASHQPDGLDRPPRAALA